MATTYELLGVATADNSGPTSLTVSSIPQTHDDLEIIFIAMDNTANYGNEVKFRINGVSSGAYNYGRYRNLNNSSSPTSTLSGDDGLAVTEGLGAGQTGQNYSAAMTKIYIAGYTEASGGTPEYGYTSGTLVSSFFWDSVTMELNNCHWSTIDASCDPVTEFSAHTTVAIQQTVREETAEEAAQREVDATNAQAQRDADEAAAAKKDADKESGNQKLRDLGLTDDEIAAITS